MDRLPAELIGLTVSFIVGNSSKEDRGVRDKDKDERSFDRAINGSLAGLATLSRKFQRAVEPHLFSHLEVQWADIGAFNAIMVGPRRTYLKSLAYVVNHKGRGTYQISKEQEFTMATSDLFRVIKSWDNDSARQTYRSSYIPLSIIVENRRKISFDPATDSRTVISGHFVLPLYAEHRHPSTFLAPVRGAPFRHFGSTDMCSLALWEALTGTEIMGPRVFNPGSP